MRVNEHLDLGYLLGRIQNGLLPTTGLAVLVTVLWGITGFAWLDITVIPIALIGLPVLSLALAHLAIAYHRFTSAERDWGLFVASVYSLGDAAVSQWLVKGRSKKPREQRDQFVSRLAALPHVVRAELRGIQSRDDIASLLNDEDIEQLRGARSPQLRLLRLIRADVERAVEEEKINGAQYAVLQSHMMSVSQLNTRLTLHNSTHAPPVLTSLTPMITTGLCLVLPLGLVTTLGWLTPFVVPLVAASVLIPSAIASSFSHPFGSHSDCLPLYRDCRETEVALLVLLGQDSLPRNLEPFGGVVR